MQNLPLTDLDRMIGLRMPVEVQNAYHDADRADASIMQQAQHYPNSPTATTSWADGCKETLTRNYR